MRNRGFSLIEVALALIIVGLVTAPMIAAYGRYKSQKQIDESTGNIASIKGALKRYVDERGHYPLPAVRNLTEADAQFGQPYPNNPASMAAMPNCSATGGDTNVCRTSSPGVPGQRIYIGDIPFAALGLPKQFIRDGYGSKFTYAVSARLTDPGTFTPNGGVIRVTDRSGGAAQDTQIGGVDAVHYVIVSHGRDRVGGFGVFGALPLPCTSPGRDRENCDNDGTFTNNFASLGAGTYGRYAEMPAGADHYDDYIGFAIHNAGGLWGLVRMTESNVTANSGADIILGTQQEPEARLDVRGNLAGMPGNVQADRLTTNRICTLDDCATASPSPPGVYEPGVFDPGIVAGSPDLVIITGVPQTEDIAQSNGSTIPVTSFPGGGIHCGQKPMNGIVNADESCSNNAPSGFDIGPGCGSGGWARAVDSNGYLICETP